MQFPLFFFSSFSNTHTAARLKADRATVPDPHLCVTQALRLGHLVGEVRLLESRGAHSLVHGRVSARRRVWRIQARLDQGLARFARDHGLELAGCKSVHVARFTGHQQKDLGSCQGGQLVRLRGEDSTCQERTDVVL